MIDMLRQDQLPSEEDNYNWWPLDNDCLQWVYSNIA